MIDSIAEKIIETLVNLTGSKEIAIIVVAMLPLIELKGAIPFGVAAGYGLIKSALLSYVGSTLVFIPVFFLLVPILKLLKKIKWFKRFAEKVEAMFERKSKDVAEKAGKESDEKRARRIKMIGVFVFVAIPLPMTGVWTGTAIAVFLGLKFRETALPIVLGNLVAGSIITLITFLFEDYVNYIILGFAVLAIILLVLAIIRIAREKTDKKDEI